jgi:hypothetical protein
MFFYDADVFVFDVPLVPIASVMYRLQNIYEPISTSAKHVHIDFRK